MVLTLLLSQDHNLWVQQAPQQHTVYVESPAVLFLFILFIIGRLFIREKSIVQEKCSVNTICTVLVISISGADYYLLLKNFTVQ